MEKENFDEELKNRIKQIFDNYDDGAADKGWDRLREKFPEKKRRDYFFWWIAAAAAVLFLGILLFWFSLSEIVNTGSGSKMVKQQPKESGSKMRQTDSVYKNVTADQKISSTKILPNFKAMPSSNTKKTSIKTALPVIAQRLPNQFQPQKTEQTETELKNQVKTKTNLQANTVFTGIKKASVDSTKKAEVVTANSATSSPKKQQEIVAQKVITTKPVAVDSSGQEQQLSVKKTAVDAPASRDSSGKKQQQIIAKAANPVIKKPTIIKKAEPTVKLLKDKSSKFSLGLYAGTHLNYASGSNSQLGLGAGVSTDFRVAKNLKLSTGLGLLQNNLSYAQSIPASSQAAASSYATASATQTSIPITQTSSLQSMDASLLALDIPVNLTYIVLPGKNSISFSAGFSSNTFVREVYNYQYNTALAAATPGTVSTSTGRTQNLQSSNSFSNFNFAKTLNLSAGFAYPLGKNKLQIEPFLKYPLGGNGSQQLIFGSAGINLKMNFATFKK